MPYRNAGQGLCAVCNHFTAGDLCPRCGRALCPEHAPLRAHRCTDCEAEYDQLSVLVRSVPIGLLALRVAVVALVCVLLMLVGQLEAFVEIGPFLTAAGGVMMLIFFAALGVIWRRRRSLRGRFLAEQHTAPSPPVRPSACCLLVRW